MENHHEQGKPRAVYETESRRLQHYRGYSVNKYGKVMLLIAAILILLMSGWLFLSDHLARQARIAECEAYYETRTGIWKLKCSLKGAQMPIK